MWVPCGIGGLAGTLLLAAAVLAPEAAAQARGAAFTTPGRPLAPGTATAGKSPSTTVDWVLCGVAITDDQRLAIVENRSSRRQQVLRVGDVLTAGTSVTTIVADRIVVADSDGTLMVLRLAHGAAPPIPRAGLQRPRRVPVNRQIILPRHPRN